MRADLAETKAKMAHFDVRFDAIERQQGDNALTQKARFDKLEQLIGALTNAFVLQPISSAVSPLLNDDKTLPQGPPSPEFRSPLTVNPQEHPLSSRYHRLDNHIGLTKARLEEFRNLLNTEDPDLVFFSETYWKPRFTCKARFWTRKSRLQ
jgi:hypothetical protein